MKILIKSKWYQKEIPRIFKFFTKVKFSQAGPFLTYWYNGLPPYSAYSIFLLIFWGYFVDIYIIYKYFPNYWTALKIICSLFRFLTTLEHMNIKSNRNIAIYSTHNHYQCIQEILQAIYTGHLYIRTNWD